MQSNNFFSTSSTQQGIVLSEKEKQALEYVEYVIRTNDSKKINLLIEDLLKYPAEVLHKLYTVSEKFKNFCQSHTQYHEAMANELEKFHYVNVEIKSMDGKEQLTIFQLYMAADTFSEYYKNLPNIRKSNEARIKCILAVETACELGLYNALTARCQQNINKILSASVSAEDKEKAVELVLSDAKRLANLYWAMGYIQGGCLLQSTAEKFSKIEGEKDRSIVMYEQGIKNLLCASLLEENPYSIKIEKSLTAGKGYLGELKDKGINVPSWEDAKLVLCDWSDSSANYDRLLTLAKQEIASLINNKTAEAEAKLSP